MNSKEMNIIVTDEFMIEQIRKIAKFKRVNETKALEMCLKVGIGTISRRNGLVGFPVKPDDEEKW